MVNIYKLAIWSQACCILWLLRRNLSCQRYLKHKNIPSFRRAKRLHSWLDDFRVKQISINLKDFFQKKNPVKIFFYDRPYVYLGYSGFLILVTSSSPGGLRPICHGGHLTRSLWAPRVPRPSDTCIWSLPWTTKTPRNFWQKNVELECEGDLQGIVVFPRVTSAHSAPGVRPLWCGPRHQLTEQTSLLPWAVVMAIPVTPGWISAWRAFHCVCYCCENEGKIWGLSFNVYSKWQLHRLVVLLSRRCARITV